ncbi:MAG: hypothetical protein VB025_09785, partial [Sphaerochaeta sp.]|nr:hypothetical protein [Sphaerochaeta sp.]
MERFVTLQLGTRSIRIPAGMRVENIITKHLALNKESLRYEDNPVIALRMNNEIMSFGARISVDATIETVRMFSDIGKRMYRHTLSYLLAYASERLFPDRRLVIAHALGDGFYFNFDGMFSLAKEDVHALAAELRSLVSEDIPIQQETVAYSA